MGRNSRLREAEVKHKTTQMHLRESSFQLPISLKISPKISELVLDFIFIVEKVYLGIRQKSTYRMSSYFLKTWVKPDFACLAAHNLYVPLGVGGSTHQHPFLVFIEFANVWGCLSSVHVMGKIAFAYLSQMKITWGI